jgi:hypothetical protein
LDNCIAYDLMEFRFVNPRIFEMKKQRRK